SGGTKHGFTSGTVFVGLGFSFNFVLTVTANELDSMQQGEILSDSARAHFPGVYINQDGTIYRIGDDGKKWGIASSTVGNSVYSDNDYSRVVPANSADRYLPIGLTLTQRSTQ